MEQQWKMRDQLEFKTSEVALDAIHFNEISPTSLSTYFVELWHMTKRPEELVNHGYEKPEMSPETIRSRAQHAMGQIDAYLTCTGRADFIYSLDGTFAVPRPARFVGVFVGIDFNFIDFILDQLGNIFSRGDDQCLTQTTPTKPPLPEIVP
jgi:hypothetical protein